MEIALVVSFLLLLALTFLATIDMAVGQLSDVGLRRQDRDEADQIAREAGPQPGGDAAGRGRLRPLDA